MDRIILQNVFTLTSWQPSLLKQQRNDGHLGHIVCENNAHEIRGAILTFQQKEIAAILDCIILQNVFTLTSWQPSLLKQQRKDGHLGHIVCENNAHEIRGAILTFQQKEIAAILDRIILQNVFTLTSWQPSLLKQQRNDGHLGHIVCENNAHEIRGAILTFQQKEIAAILDCIILQNVFTLTSWQPSLLKQQRKDGHLGHIVCENNAHEIRGAILTFQQKEIAAILDCIIMQNVFTLTSWQPSLLKQQTSWIYSMRKQCP